MKSGLQVGGIMCKEFVEEHDVSDVKVKKCDGAERSDQRYKIPVSFALSSSLFCWGWGDRMHIYFSLMTYGDKTAGISSFRIVDSCSSCFPLEFCYPVVSIHKVTQSSPSPVLSFVERVPQETQTSHITAVDSEHGYLKSENESTSSKTIRDVHISMRLMEDFLELAKENTEKDLETCGILGAFLCLATNEEDVFAILNERSLFPVGWIHTHPSQNCFMSSVDLHTQYSYQIMVPEAFAIVLAPKDTSRSCGLFRITEPDGMSILKGCQETGFHPHKEPENGNPMYEHCSNVYKNSNLRFEIFDLR
ncbi:AMSH-like ubiquitin thioesterase 2 isoform X2 [Senna tora]|uniref:AMSH-like ubiquitin thioesterase 2 isoform X2 n=1 Tax=Senna tora TaxID=362788 RepID=A0A834TVZ5_9FABA|nr:AMSH-like ubiquitin thioesterase 2 isoform X2 [Senna tora]